ncbi:Kynurenine formamidase [Paenibacillus sp. UNC496MF]|uniref:arylformamidase n=1 Tax=Paenibacillus sp. UNC496MF TaxID=1502753 RepID=UPI0008EB9E75|nr:arylformamidase [Paenibacillus sp. UNC496MF]SFJ15894.1 Kynurenine formamidase [Paenibacillus sp. UNC496MF]
MNANKWIDISQPLDERTAGWPGDTPFAYERAWRKEDTGSVNVGRIRMSLHTGTHIDAPYHFDDAGAKAIDLELDVYLGEAIVVHVPGARAIGIGDLIGVELGQAARLLLRTDAWPDRHAFPAWIPPVEPELAAYLAARGVRLLGLDLPSVDPLDSKELPAHHALAAHGIHILEGLVLDHVEPGRYELAALPLPLAQADGSPTRAALRKLV